MRRRAIQTGGQSVEWDRKELGRDPRGCTERQSRGEKASSRNQTGAGSRRATAAFVLSMIGKEGGGLGARPMSKVGNRNFPAIVQGDCSRRGDSNAARRALVPRWLCLLIGHRGPHTQYWPLSLAQPSPALSLLPACSWAATCMLPPLLVRCALSASWDDDDNNREHLWIFCPTPVSRSIRQMQLPY